MALLIENREFLQNDTREINGRVFHDANEAYIAELIAASGNIIDLEHHNLSDIRCGLGFDGYYVLTLGNLVGGIDRRDFEEKEIPLSELVEDSLLWKANCVTTEIVDDTDVHTPRPEATIRQEKIILYIDRELLKNG